MISQTAFVIILIALYVSVFGVVVYMAYDSIKEKDYAIAIFMVLSALLLAVIPLAFYESETNKITEGTIVETGHNKESCSTMYIKAGDVMMPSRTCTPAHDYIVIEKGDKRSLHKIDNKDNYKVGDYFIKETE